MRKILVPLLLLMLLCVSLAAPAGGEDAVTLQLDTAKLPVFEADDPLVSGLLAEQEGDALPVLLVSLKKSVQLRITVLPKNLKNKKVTLSVDNGDIVRIRGNTLTGQALGETVLTIASAQEPTAQIQYRVLVIQPVTRISLVPSAKFVYVGETITLAPTIQPENASILKTTFASSAEQIATVDENGVVTGLKRGSARIIVTAMDGSNVRANISIPVQQKAEEVQLKEKEITVDVKRTSVLHATVLPKDANDKGVLWTSSDESIATVNNQGRVTGVAPGDCEIICTSKVNEAASTKAVVHVQQPVTKITLYEASTVYAGETGQITWSVEPANATNPGIQLSSGNPKILQVSEDGTLTGIAAGETVVKAVSTDGSNRRAQIKVRVLQHLTGVHMYRKTAYLDVRESGSALAVLEPNKLVNTNMTWESGDESIATVKPVANQPKAMITGVMTGDTYVTGTTEDGGYQATIQVRVGDFSHLMRITDAFIDGKGRVRVTVKNKSDDLYITAVTLEIEAFKHNGKKAHINAKDGSNICKATYRGNIAPGRYSPDNGWKMIDYDENVEFGQMIVRVVEYQIENDWIKVLRKNVQPTYEYWLDY